MWHTKGGGVYLLINNIEPPTPPPTCGKCLWFAQSTSYTIVYMCGIVPINSGMSGDEIYTD